MSRHAKVGPVLATAIAMMISAPAGAATIYEIQFQGATLGCFGTTVSCGGAYASPVTMNLGGVDIGFTGAGFDETTDGTGAASFALGTFTRPDDKSNFTAFATDFTLRIQFALPTAITGGQVSLLEADLIGTVSGQGQGNSFLNMDFPNAWIPFTFANALGEGSFEFAIPFDPAEMNKNDPSRTVSGSVRNAVFRTFETEPQPNPVPEPATLLLLGAGLAAGASRMRRRRARHG